MVEKMEKLTNKNDFKLFWGAFLVLAILLVTPILVSFPLEKENYHISTLKKILNEQILNLPENREGWECIDYTLYYNKTLKDLYPKLDVRKINMAGICPIGTKECGDYEGIPHTYIIVNGYGEECILDQTKYVCINLFEGKNEE